MADAGSTGNRTTNWIRWIARAVDSLVAAFWLFVGVANAIVEPGPWTLKSVIMAGLIATSALGVLIAWWREGPGGTVVLVCGVAHSAFAYLAAGHNRVLAMLVSGVPLLVAGILFLLSQWRSREDRSLA